MDIERSWNSWLRRQSRPTVRSSKPVICTICTQEVQNEADHEKHVRESHSQLLSEKATEEEKISWIRSLWNAAQPPGEKDGNRPAAADQTTSPRSGRVAAGESQPSPTQPSNRDRSGRPNSARASQSQQQQKHRDSGAKSPTSSLRPDGDRSQSPSKKSKARPTSTVQTNEAHAEFSRGPSAQKGSLWDPQTDPLRAARPSQPLDKSNVASSHRIRSSASSQPRSQRQGHPVEEESVPADLNLIKQPETRPISQEQLVTEVKGIYAGLVMVESKCIEVDHAQNAETDPANKQINNEQWQALIALHRTLLHEHHDFFLASQHPSASHALRRLASKYAMPARMWRHGIHSFLELLRHRLPASLEHMLTFIYLAYSMMALLYETVPAFEDTWIECLGDLGRYRMAIEDDDLRDREVWTGVSKHWYSKASDKSPTTGRLYHHLAILARPNVLQQLFYYSKSLCVPVPFLSARESIMTLFEPHMAAHSSHQSRLAATELAFIRVHGALFSRKSQDNLNTWMNDFLEGLDNHIGRSTSRWREPGYFMGIAICCAIIGWGNETNPIFNAIKPVRSDEPADQVMTGTGIEEPAPKELTDALRLANQTHNIVFRRYGDDNIMPYLHVTLVFIYHLTFYPQAMAHLAPEFPWELLALMLNTLLNSCKSYSRIESERFPQSGKGDLPRPLPEDYAMRGLLWVDRYFPGDWFSNDKIDDEEKYFEVASMTEERKIRVLHLACRISAQGCKWLRYNPETHQFIVRPRHDSEQDATTPESNDYGELPDAAVNA